MASPATAASSTPPTAAARPAKPAALHSARGTIAVSAPADQASPALTPTQQRLLAGGVARAAGLAGGGSITGVAQASGAAPLGGVCVTATGPSGRPLAMTPPDGPVLHFGRRARRDTPH